MAYHYTQIDGKRVEVNVAAAFRKLNAAFQKAFPGVRLVVTWGTRTRAEQVALFNKYGFPQAAYPGTSNHEESGPRGPRALDIRDTGSNPGVTVSGTARANWIRANARKYGLDPAGYRFLKVEPWHIEYTGALAQSAPAAVGAKPLPTPTRQEDELSAKAEADLEWIKVRLGGTNTDSSPSITRLINDQANRQVTELQKAVTTLIRVIRQGQGRVFYKHGGMPSTNPLWVYVLPSGDFVRIRDQKTADLYGAMNGGAKSIELTGEAIRLLISDLTAAGGRDLSELVDEAPTAA